MSHSRVSEGETISPEVWDMKRKRRVQTRDIYKYKDLMNIDGSKMIPGVHYNQTYAPLMAWDYIHIILSTILYNDWKTMHLD